MAEGHDRFQHDSSLVKGFGMALRVVLCLALGTLAGFAAGVLLSATDAKTAAGWALGIFAFLWTVILGMMGKIADVTDLEGLSNEEHQKLEHRVKEMISRLWALARFNVLLALIGLGTSLLIGKPDIAQFVPTTAIGVLVSFGLIGILLYEQWTEELRAFRSSVKARVRIEKAKDKLFASLPPSSCPPPENDQFAGYGKVIKPKA